MCVFVCLLAGFYVEYFQHRQAQAPQYCVASSRALAGRRLTLTRLWPHPVKPAQRIAFEHAQRELEQIQRIREVGGRGGG